ncbi:hypothetical protein H8E88_19325 [candidate division KSB1 bacterium]|nr:hypothetical protein [candidate division KSB1 bacterium]
MAKKDKEVTITSDENVPVAFDMEQDAEGGHEGADSDSYAIPFLSILQKGSPQVDEDKGEFIPEAKAGMFFNTVTQQLYNGETGVVIIPCAFSRVFIEWGIDQGGFKGIYSPSDPIINTAVRDETGKFMLPGNQSFLADTRQHFVLIFHEQRFDQIVISLSSTQLKKSRNWMSQMRSMKIPGKSGPYTPPTFSHMYLATTIPEANEKGSWRGWKIALDRVLDPSIQLDVILYQAAKKFRQLIVEGKAQVSPPVADGVDDDTPF